MQRLLSRAFHERGCGLRTICIASKDDFLAYRDRDGENLVLLSTLLLGELVAVRRGRCVSEPVRI